MGYLNKTLIALCCSTTVFLTACNHDKNDKFSSEEKVYVSEKPYVLDSVSGAADIQVMTYRMQSVQNKTVDATALVIFPETAPPAGGYRTVVWLHGTLGVGDSCAPTNNILGPRFKDPLAKSLLAAGYVIVAPDYEGLGTPGIHPYLNLESEAKSAISAVKAAKEHYGKKLNAQWMSIGQSQGGQASLGVAEYANQDKNYKGAVAGAPASSLDTIMFDVAPSYLAAAEAEELAYGLTIDQRKAYSINGYATLLTYAAFAAVGIKASDPRFDYGVIFSDIRSELIAEKAEGTTGENGLCLDSADPVNDPEASLRYLFIEDIAQFLKDNPDKSILDYPGLDQQVFENSPEIQKFLKESQPGTKKIDKPIMIIQGTSDMSVPYVVTNALVDSMQKLGTSVDYVLVPGASHTGAIVQENQKAVDFIEKYMPAK